jgi:hypothetical protein
MVNKRFWAALDGNWATNSLATLGIEPVAILQMLYVAKFMTHVLPERKR